MVERVCLLMMEQPEQGQRVFAVRPVPAFVFVRVAVCE